MPCRSDQEFAQGPDEPNAVTPPRRRINDGAGRNKSDVEISDENDEHEVANPEKTKRGIGGSQCGRDRPGFGCHAVSEKLRAIQYYRVLNIIILKLYNVL